MTWVVGLTGGIASGKSAAGDHFAELSVPVLDADQVSRDVVKPGSEGLQKLVKHFGADILTDAGELDRPAMRQTVFSEPRAREELEAILHPLIRQRLLDWQAQQDRSYCVLMIPLLVRMGWKDLVDRLLLIDCPVEMQLERLKARDDISEELARNMISAQESREERSSAADDIILNTGSLGKLQSMVEYCHQHYLRAAENPVAPLPPLRLPVPEAQVQ